MSHYYVRHNYYATYVSRNQSVFTQLGHVSLLFCTRKGGILKGVWVENGVIDLSISKKPSQYFRRGVFVTIAKNV